MAEEPGREHPEEPRGPEAPPLRVHQQHGLVVPVDEPGLERGQERRHGEHAGHDRQHAAGHGHSRTRAASAASIVWSAAISRVASPAFPER